MAAIAERALRSDQAQRYPDAGAFASELLVYQAGGRVEAYRYGPLEHLWKFVKRNRVLSAALAASVLVLVGGVGTGLVQLRQARVNPVSAPIERARRADDLGEWARAAATCATGGVHEGTTAALGEFALPRQWIPERLSASRSPWATRFSSIPSDGASTRVREESRRFSASERSAASTP